MKKAVIFLFSLLLLVSCDVMKQIGGAYNVTQCKYDFHSIENMELAGVNIGKPKTISIAEIASLTTILSGGNMQNIPLSMILNLDVQNPNEDPAFLNGLDYMIELNDMEFVSGKLDVPFKIEAGETSTIPLSIGLDLKKLMNRYSKDKVASEMSRFMGVSPGQSKVTLKLWPKVLIGNVPIKSPAHIPVTFMYGSEK